MIKKNLKVIQLSNSDSGGGAGKSCYRLHQGLRKLKIDSHLYVNEKLKDDESVHGPNNIFMKLFLKSRPRFVNPIKNLLVTQNKIIHSPSILPSNWPKFLNKSDVDIVNLHWVQKEMISIRDIKYINKPIVWTFHDMWPICGSEHVSYDQRWLNGYLKTNRPNYESGFDLNKFTWEQKRKYWKRKFFIVTPSKWLSSYVSKSILFKDFPVRTIPNCLDMKLWKPIDKFLARELFNLQKEKKIILFGTMDSNDAHHKGLDLLKESLNKIKSINQDVELVIIGQKSTAKRFDFAIKTHYMGVLKDTFSLIALYSAADLVLTPSRIESFSNVAAEAQACATPVVAFDRCGFLDVVEHKKTGYLANSFDTSDFARGIEWILSDKNKQKEISKQSRLRAITLWNEKRISGLYKSLYEEIIENHNRNNFKN